MKPILIKKVFVPHKDKKFESRISVYLIPKPSNELKRLLERRMHGPLEDIHKIPGIRGIVGRDIPTSEIRSITKTRSGKRMYINLGKQDEMKGLIIIHETDEGVVVGHADLSQLGEEVDKLVETLRKLEHQEWENVQDEILRLSLELGRLSTDVGGKINEELIKEVDKALKKRKNT